eukprot:449597-Pleurochrysis_carterae.AAC.1
MATAVSTVSTGKQESSCAARTLASSSAVDTAKASRSAASRRCRSSAACSVRIRSAIGDSSCGTSATAA